MEVVKYNTFNKNYTDLVVGKTYVVIRETLMGAYILQGHYGAFSKFYFTNIQKERNRKLNSILSVN